MSTIDMRLGAITELDRKLAILDRRRTALIEAKKTVKAALKGVSHTYLAEYQKAEFLASRSEYLALVAVAKAASWLRYLQTEAGRK